MLTFDEAAHLLRRAGFGGPPKEIQNLMEMGRDAAVNYLVDYQNVDNRKCEKRLKKGFGTLLDGLFALNTIQNWWMTRMVITRRPLEEKLTLFWHGLFATSDSDLFTRYGFRQNLTLRQNALERFDTIVLAIARDPAMIVFLNTNENEKEHPNENYARELMELHTMGINDVVTGEPNYSQKDVTEIARAFTGWKIRPGQRFSDATFFFEEGKHDSGLKTIFGRSPVNLNGDDVVTIICERPAAARYIVKRLIEFFGFPLNDSFEDKALIERFAGIYFQTDHSIREVLRAFLKSDEFYSPRARFALRKSPVELVVGAIRMFNADLTVNNRSSVPSDRARRMGQSLFNPPSVAGWPPEQWYSTGNLIERFNFATHLASVRSLPFNVVDAMIQPAELEKHSTRSAVETVDNFLSLAGPLDVDAVTRQHLVNYLQTRDGAPANFRPTTTTIDRKVRGLVSLIMMLPQFQVA